MKRFRAFPLARHHLTQVSNPPLGPQRMERKMKQAWAIAAVAMGLGFASPATHAQGYVVNGRAATPAEVHLLVSSGAQPGQWVVDGLGISSAETRNNTQTTSRNGDRKCWYVLDVQLCE